MVANWVEPNRGCSCVSCIGNECSMKLYVGNVVPPPEPNKGPTRSVLHDSGPHPRCNKMSPGRLWRNGAVSPSNIFKFPRWGPLINKYDFLARNYGPFKALVRKQSDMEYYVANLTKEVGLMSLEVNLVGTSEHVTPHSHVRTTRQTCYLL